MYRHRRRLLQTGFAFAGLGLLAGCGLVRGPAAAPAAPRRIGLLLIETESSSERSVAAVREGLAELGYVEGRDVVFEPRYAAGHEERLSALAADLVAQQVDAIVTQGNGGIRAAKAATTTIPIVFATAPADPAADGLVASLARPGGNATGLTLYAGEEHAKRVQLFKEALPGLSRLAVLWHPSNVGAFRETEAAVKTLGLELVPLQYQGPEQIEAVLDGALTGRADGLVMTVGAVFNVVIPRITAWALQHRLPAMYANITFVDEGGLLVYATNTLQNWRRLAYFLDRIFKGTNPGDLPVERPTRLEFVINLRTAEAVGITIPTEVLQQATRVIQ